MRECAVNGRPILPVVDRVSDTVDFPAPARTEGTSTMARLLGLRNLICIMLALLATVPWLVRANPAPARVYSHAPRVTLRQVDKRLDRIEAELMAIYRRVGGKESDQFPVPPWLLKDRFAGDTTDRDRIRQSIANSGNDQD